MRDWTNAGSGNPAPRRIYRGQMETTDYNGSTHLITKIEELLGSKKLSPTAAIRLLLESQLHNIKARHDMEQQIEQLKLDTQKEIAVIKKTNAEEIALLRRTSVGLYVYNNPGKALVFFLLAYSFAISDLRQPFMDWVVANLKAFTAIF